MKKERDLPEDSLTDEDRENLKKLSPKTKKGLLAILTIHEDRAQEFPVKLNKEITDIVSKED